jgi:formylglycine-generating enzyme required for sulfatase activity
MSVGSNDVSIVEKELEFIHVPGGEGIIGFNGDYFNRANNKANNNAHNSITKNTTNNTSPFHLSKQRITMRPFYISKHPITNRIYDVFRTTVPETSRDIWQGKFQDCPWAKGDTPVVGVSFFDAILFCEWLGEILDSHISLPLETEWEYAARYPDGRRYPWGNEYPDSSMCNLGYLHGPRNPLPVHYHSPQGDSYLGISQLVGNVWEWTLSPFVLDDHSMPGIESQLNKRLSLDLNSLEPRAARGSCFNTTSALLPRLYMRGSLTPYARKSSVGFRVVLLEDQ